MDENIGFSQSSRYIGTNEGGDTYTDGWVVDVCGPFPLLPRAAMYSPANPSLRIASSSTWLTMFAWQLLLNLRPPWVAPHYYPQCEAAWAFDDGELMRARICDSTVVRLYALFGPQSPSPSLGDAAALGRNRGAVLGSGVSGPVRITPLNLRSSRCHRESSAESLRLL